MEPQEIIEKSRKMQKSDNEQFVGQFLKNKRTFSVYLTNNFCLNHHKFHVIVDGTMSRYTSQFDDNFFNDVEQAFKDRI